MEKVVSLTKRRGFIYQGSEIYGGLANSYDYGPLGTELLRNIRNLWWKFFIQNRSDMVGLDSSIISHHKVWEASGHVAGFADAMIDCRNCKARMRADHLIEGYFEKKGEKKAVEGLTPKELDEIIKENEIKCPVCGKIDWTDVRKFNLLFPVQLGIVEGEQGQAYLRGETAQGIFINFKNVIDSSRVRLPFGIGQIGKSFRNEITPGNSIFRTIEFEQAEIEYFFDPNRSNWEELFNEWKERIFEFVLKDLGVRAENLRWREHDDKERSFYSKRTEDLEYNFPFGFKELWGLAYRTNYDLMQHTEASKKDLTIMDPVSNEKILPHVIEPAVSFGRLILMILLDSYEEKDGRTLLKLNPKLAPYKAAVFPLLANKDELVNKAKSVYDGLKTEFNIAWDDRGNIGKRYLSQDEAGTPFCITVDFETLENDSVTVRDRDSATQERVKIEDLKNFISSKIQ